MDVDILGLSPSRQTEPDDFYRDEPKSGSGKRKNVLPEDDRDFPSPSTPSHASASLSNQTVPLNAPPPHDEGRHGENSDHPASTPLASSATTVKAMATKTKPVKPEASRKRAEGSMKETKEVSTSKSEASVSSQPLSARHAKLALKGHAGEVLGCEWNPLKEDMLATCSADSTVRLWTLQEEMSKASSAALHHGAKVKPGMRAPTQVTRIAWNTSGNYLASSSLDGSLRLWHAGHLVPKTVLHAKHIAHEGPIFALKWAPTLFASSASESASTGPGLRDMVATAGADGILKLWSVTMPPRPASATSSGSTPLATPLESLVLHQASILDVDFAATRLTATAGQDGSVKVTNSLWKYPASDAASQASIAPSSQQTTVMDCKGHLEAVNSVQWSISRTPILATASDDCTLRLWSGLDAQMHEAVERASNTSVESTRTLSGHNKGVFLARWNPGSNAAQLASASFDGSVKLWNAETGSCTATCNTHTDSVIALDYSSQGATLATGSLDKSIAIWDTSSGTLVKQYQCSGCVLDVSFNPFSNHKLSACFSDNSAVVFDIRM